MVAVSGGVDSSIAAAMLLKEGYNVIGVMLRLWSEAGKECENKCCTPQSMEDARRSAQALAYPFHVIDAAEIFRNHIVQYFLDEYQKGKTPNPCVVCNRDIKWGLLFNQLDEFGADYLATGHYVRLVREPGKKVKVFKARDRQKDQSYVMCMLTQEQLSRTIFPLGDLLKPEVREMARSLNLPMAEKKESQDLCFVSDTNYHDFLVRNAPDIAQPGNIVDRSGKVLGTHNGLAFYTIGQRKGIGISAAEPLYVLEKKEQTNLLVVGTQDQLSQERIHVAGVNWISGKIPQKPIRAEVKIRYKSELRAATISPDGDRAVMVRFDQPVRDASPGQFAVFYDQDELLGGGEIIAAGY